jgi:hypothetical protein
MQLLRVAVGCYCVTDDLSHTAPMLHNVVKQGDIIYIGRCVSCCLFVHRCCPI